MINRQQLITAYRQACELDILAFKPGNVSVYQEGHDMTVADFLISAEVSAEALTDPNLSLGEKIYAAVAATKKAVGCNTNLGIVLLCAPLLQAAHCLHIEQTLHTSLQQLLINTTLQDADWVFRAIALATPAGLGETAEQDVHNQASVTLIEAMALAKNKDRIALQYVSNFVDIFDYTVFVYNATAEKFADTRWAALAVYAALLAHFPDSHIERKYGKRYTPWVMEEMTKISEALSTLSNPDYLFPELYRVDSAFKANNINPGTTADLTVATVLAVFLEKLISKNN